MHPVPKHVLTSYTTTDNPLAQDFLLTQGYQEVTLPSNLPTRSDYIIDCKHFNNRCRPMFPGSRRMHSVW